MCKYACGLLQKYMRSTFAEIAIGEHLCSLCDMCAYTSNFAKLMVNAGVSICVYCGFC